MSRLLKLSTIAALSAIACTNPLSAVELKVLSAWDRSFSPRVYMADRFAEIATELSKGDITFSFRGPETVPPFNQFEPVKAGVFDILFTTPTYHRGEKGIGIALDAITEWDPTKRRAAGIFNFVDEYYRKNNNIRLLAMTAANKEGYQIVLRRPLSSAGDWAGRKIAGVVSYDGVVRALGGSTVVIPPGDRYTALDTGVADGIAWPTIGFLDWKFNEVAKYRIKPSFGIPNWPIFINENSFKRLTPQQQAVLLEAGKRIELESVEVGQKLTDKESDALTKLGMETVQLSAENGVKIRKAWADSAWKLARECCGDAADQLRKLAVDAGMSE